MPRVDKVAVFVIGPDRPGIIAAATQALFEQGYNLEDVSQTSLQGQFVGIFLASAPAAGTTALREALRARLDPLGLFVHLGPVGAAGGDAAIPAEPFVITTVGPDRPGLVAGIAGLLAQFGANITNLKAVTRDRGGRQEYVTFYEADLPADGDRRAFRAALQTRAAALGLEVNLQHREIFERIHRV